MAELILLCVLIATIMIPARGSRQKVSDLYLMSMMICQPAVLVAVAVDREGRPQILVVELANRESRSAGATFFWA